MQEVAFGVLLIQDLPTVLQASQEAVAEEAVAAAMQAVVFQEYLQVQRSM